MIGNLITGINMASVAPFNPTSISGCKLWLDAADTATISLSGSAVTQWSDKSGNSYNFSQATSARRPTSGVNTQNGNNVVTFSGSQLLQAANSNNWTFLSNSSGSTIFMAIYAGTRAGVDALLENQQNTTGNPGIIMYRYTYIANEVTNGSGWAYNTTLGSLTNNTPYYLTMLSDPANATANNRFKLSINNGAYLQGNTETGSPSASVAPDPLILGALETNGNNGWVGRIAEVIMYQGILSGTDITKVNSYLATKWGI